MKEITLTEDQEKASSMFTRFLLDEDAKFMVIKGAAGTGKSTLVKTLLETVESRLQMYSILLGSKDDTPEFTIELTASTNKAAAVLSELTGQPCSTVHSRLGLAPKENWQTGEINFVKGRGHEPIYNALLVVDEASFINDELFRLIDESTIDCKILLIGDEYQLAPVKQLIPIMDKIQGYTVSLDKIMRHGGNIAKAGAKFRETVNTGVFSPITVDTVNVTHTDGPTFQRMIDHEFTQPDYSEHKARILAWQNDTVNAYNVHIRGIRGLPPQFGRGDVLMTNRQINTDKKRLAGTDGSVCITEIGRDDIQYDIPGRRVYLNDTDYSFFLPNNPHQASAFMKKLGREKKWPLFFMLQKQWLDLRPAFASTVHKAQGSTYDTVFINLTDIGKCRVPSDVARMMYVGVTRAAQRVILYGQLPPMYTGAFNEQRSAVTA